MLFAEKYARRAAPFMMLLCLLLLGSSVSPQDDETPIPPEVMRIGRGVIHALEWSPDGDTLAVASTTGVWRLDSNLNVVERLAGREMYAVAWSADGKYLAMSSTAQDDCRLTVYDMESEERAFMHKLCADTLVWSPDGAQIAAVHRGIQQVTLVNAEGLTLLPVPGRSAVWSPDGARVAVSGAGGLFIWDIEAGLTDLARAVQGYAGVLRWDVQGIMILCHEQGETRNTSGLCLVDPLSGEEVTRDIFIYRHPGELSEMSDMHLNPAGDHFSFVLSNQPSGALPNMHILNTADHSSRIVPGSLAAWHPESAVVTIAAGNGALRSLNTEDGEPLAETVPFTAPVSSVAWSPDGAWLVSTSDGDDPFLCLWDVEQDPFAPRQIFAAGQPAQQVDWLSDSSAFTASGQLNRDGLVTRGIGQWSVAGHSVEANSELVPVDEMPVVGLSHDLTRRATSQPGTNSVMLDDLTLSTAAPWVQAISWSRDDAWIATLSTTEEPGLAIIEVWDAASGDRLSTAVLEGIKQVHPAVFWSSTGMLLHITARTNAYDAYAVYAYDTTSGLLRFQYGTPQFYPPQSAYHPHDTVLAVETLTAIIFVDTQIGTLYRDQIPAGYIHGLDWHPGGLWLAGAGGDGTIRVWDVSVLNPSE